MADGRKMNREADREIYRTLQSKKGHINQHGGTRVTENSQNPPCSKRKQDQEIQEAGTGTEEATGPSGNNRRRGRV